LSAVTVKKTLWPASAGDPALIAVAQAGRDCGPASSTTTWLGPATNVGG
jgi:hypothetical protein